MKPWMILLSSAFVAVAAAAGAALPELSLARHSGNGLGIAALAPMLIVTFLAGYALCAILLATANLVGGCVLLRYRLARLPAHRGASHPDWISAFEASGLGRLAPVPATSPRWGRVPGTSVLQSRFHPQEARREIARLYYICAARSHFFSALIVLAAIAALGLAQRHGPLPEPFGLVPMVPALLILVGLVLLAALGRLAVDVTAEPLIDMLSQLPAEPLDIVLLRRAVDLLEAGSAVKPARDDSAAIPPPQLSERIVGAFEEGRRALLEAIGRLSATTEGLAASTRSAIEGLEATIRDSDRQPIPASQPAILDTAEVTRLHEAVVALTAALERAPATTLTETDPLAAVSGILPVSRDPDPRVADELKRLLAEMGTTS